jgi:eukaryotic-like serine/threonine-protein kinase
MSRSHAPLWMYLAAVSFIGYFVLLVHNNFFGPPEVGFSAKYEAECTVLTQVAPGTPAARAGLRPSDHLLAMDGQPVRSLADWLMIQVNLEGSRDYSLDIERGNERLKLTLALDTFPRSAFWTAWEWRQYLTVRGAQFLMLLIALLIAFVRPHDLIARVGALLLATVSVGNPEPPLGIAASIQQLPLPVSVLFSAVFASAWLASPLFFAFCAVFPRPLFRRRWPWFLACVPAILIGSVATYGTYYGVYRSGHLPFSIPGWFLTGGVFFGLGYLLGGVAALITNYRRLEEPNGRRRVRVMVTGFVLGWLPAFPVALYSYWPPAGKALASYFASPVSALANIFYLAFPISFAYAILRHRLFDIRVMIRQGLQYALARRLVFSLVPACAVIMVLDFFAHRDQTIRALLQARGWVYLLLGGLAGLAHTKRESWVQSLDQRFFRERYNAQRLLREIAEDSRQAGSFQGVGPRVVAQIEAALHPEFAALLVREPQEKQYSVLASAPVGKALPPPPADGKLISLVRLMGKPLQVADSESGWLQQQLPSEETDYLRRTRLDLLVPIAMAPDRTEALLALGLKRSEEPYSREDQDLLVAIGSSLALLLEKPKEALPVARTKELFEECPQCGTCYASGSGRCAKDGAALVPALLSRLLADRYRLERRIGSGGMGTVYEATDMSLERRVAVKVIRDDLVGSIEAAERFRREARAAASLAHLNVVTVFDFGTAGRRAFLVMELLNGTSLRDELRRQGRLAPPRVVAILRGVTSAVDAGHRQQLLHRDLKPGNIFLVQGETGEVPKVLDFGVAKFLPTDTQVTWDSDTGGTLLVGTPGYMSPEQLRGGLPDLTWDLWALAVVAYEMLAGVHPFSATTSAELQSAVLAGRFTPIKTYVAEAPERWQQFFEFALASDPHRRPSSADIFFSELARAIP